MSNPFQGGDIVSVVDNRDLDEADRLFAGALYTVLHVTTYMVVLEARPGAAYHYSRFILQARPSHLDGDAEREHLHEGLNMLFVDEPHLHTPFTWASPKLAAEMDPARVAARFVELQREIDSDETAHELNRTPVARPYTPIPEELAIAFDDAPREFPDAYYSDYEAALTPEELAEFSLEGVAFDEPASDAVAIKHDQEKPRLSLIPRCAIEAEARVLTHGARKYTDHNWRRGFAWSRLIDAAMRHLVAFADGEDNDPETGELHVAHLRCCTAFLIEHIEHGLGTDDRYKRNGV